MADKSFGVKEFNLITGSGTPTIQSPNNLNLTANTVAISANSTVGGTLDVSGTLSLINSSVTPKIESATNNLLTADSSDYVSLYGAGTKRIETTDVGVTVTGKVTASSSSGTPTIESGTNNLLTADSSDYVTLYGAGNTKLATTATGVTITGAVSATSFSGGGNDIVTSQWTIGANGTSDYTFTGPGGLSNANDPTIYLARGKTYEFVMNTGGAHPFQIRVSDGGSAYNTGVTNNGASSGTIKFEVPFAAPNTLVYQCTSHSSMLGNIVVYPSI